jgi:NAD(P)-dependent dehydrogenase (short-subunit alcohol dehydrogenase family)
VGFDRTCGADEVVRGSGVGLSEECAHVIAFLATNAASYVHGEMVEINGGQLMV